MLIMLVTWLRRIFDFLQIVGIAAAGGIGFDNFEMTDDNLGMTDDNLRTTFDNFGM